MKAILLAAGASRRLQPLTQNTPKCLIKIGDKTILEHQLDSVIEAGIRDVVIVVGYLKNMIIDFVNKNYSSLNSVKFIENKEYSTTNTIYSLYLTREEFINDDFIYFNADVLFHSDIVKNLVSHNGNNVLAVDYKKCGEEEVKFVTEGGRIVKLGKYIPTDEAEGEFIGVAKFGKNIAADFIKALEYYSTNGQKNLFFEKAVEDILDKDFFHPLDVSDIPNIEIDFPEDLEEAINKVYPAIVEYESSKS